MFLKRPMALNDVNDYASVCRYIESSACLGSRPGLARIQALCGIMGDPQDDLSFIHIAGTNGKGSTAAMIASALTGAHIRVGMYYSPALCGIKDHYAIDGEIISNDDYAVAVGCVAAANEILRKNTGEGATQFELETAVALSYFQKKNCDVVVLETGMGGAEDATNVVKNKICCVITSISYDHMQYLGNTLADIAKAKAGIITSDCPVIALDASPEATEVIRQQCSMTGSRLYTVDPQKISMVHDHPTGEIINFEEFKDIRVALSGTFQAENAGVALRTLEVISRGGLIPGCRFDGDDLYSGLAKVRWPYRFEMICDDPTVIVDGAHNADAAAKLRATLEDRFAGYRIILVIGMFRDKEYEKVAAQLAGLAYRTITVSTPDNPRALPAKDLAAVAGHFCENVTACETIEEAYELAVQACKGLDKSMVIACGSLSYLAIFRECNDKWKE